MYVCIYLNKCILISVENVWGIQTLNRYWLPGYFKFKKFFAREYLFHKNCINIIQFADNQQPISLSLPSIHNIKIIILKFGCNIFANFIEILLKIEKFFFGSKYTLVS